MQGLYDHNGHHSLHMDMHAHSGAVQGGRNAGAEGLQGFLLEQEVQAAGGYLLTGSLPVGMG